MTRPVRTRPRLRLPRPPVRPRPEAERGRNGGGRAVRATQRAQALAGVRAWYATADIARHATVLAALVAAASLAVSAWGTFKAAQVADDQLAQSRDNTEAATRRQVSQITMWLQPLDGHRTYVIANRSLDAASLYLQIDYGPDGHEAAHLLRVGVAPPCTRMELSVRSAHLAVRTPPRNRPSLRTYRLNYLIVRDAGGKIWKRESTGTLASLPALPEFADARKRSLPEDAVRIRPLEQCGNGT